VGIRDIIRRYTPKVLLDQFRFFKKKRVNKILEKEKKSGNVFTLKMLLLELKRIGLKEGDTVLVHSSLSKIGYVEGGPVTIVDALLEAVGEKGNLLMPSSPSPGSTKEYLDQSPVFDVKETPSRMGVISEEFRKRKGVVRSLHPTEPVCAFGPDAKELTKDHFGQLTPYNENSPFYKVSEKEGKILMIGTTLINSGTSLHTLEDVVSDFVYPVYDQKVYNVVVIDEKGEKHEMETKVHSVEMANKRKCDGLFPIFEKENVVTYGNIGNAKSILYDSKKMLEVMLKYYYEKKVTMYTPEGEELG